MYGHVFAAMHALQMREAFQTTGKRLIQWKTLIVVSTMDRGNGAPPSVHTEPPTFVSSVSIYVNMLCDFIM